MNKLFRQMLSVWLAIVLAAAPVPLFSAPQTGSGQAHCMSVNGREHSQRDTMASAAHVHVEASQMQSSCKHCDNNRCASAACADQGCSPCHAANLIMAPVFLAALIRFSEIRPTRAATDLVSLTYPPLLHPPSLPHIL